MQFTPTKTSIYALILLAIPSLINAGVCQEGEISVGVEETCQLGNENGGNMCVDEPKLWASDCGELDKFQNGDQDYCGTGWDRATVTCSGQDVTGVVLDGVTFGNCYKPGGNGLCSSAPEGYDNVYYCCPQIS